MSVLTSEECSGHARSGGGRDRQNAGQHVPADDANAESVYEIGGDATGTELEAAGVIVTLSGHAAQALELRAGVFGHPAHPSESLARRCTNRTRGTVRVATARNDARPRPLRSLVRVWRCSPFARHADRLSWRTRPCREARPGNPRIPVPYRHELELDALEVRPVLLLD